MVTSLDQSQILSSFILNHVSSKNAYLLQQLPVVKVGSLLVIQDLTNYNVTPRPISLELYVNLVSGTNNVVNATNDAQLKLPIPMRFSSMVSLSMIPMRTALLQLPCTTGSVSVIQGVQCPIVQIYMDRLKMNV